MLPTLITIAETAGEQIMAVYQDPQLFAQLDHKSDQSPLTLADRRAHTCIADALAKHFPDIPLLSEEGKHTPYATRKDWTRFWLVDPLDGTKEFVQRNGDFTVNIALIDKGKPILGVIVAPAYGHTYTGIVGQGATRKSGTQSHPIQVRHRTRDWVALVSRAHASPEEQVFLADYPVTETQAVGSSLKFCRIAEGAADCYLRTGPTMEWDTAAGQAILEAAGGTITQIDGSPMTYNKENLRNPAFWCLGGKTL
ncbi:MAG: 3'(2'),5'-bisphosphate nucleotidase CysQ [Bernardetiaceae bacterium]